jgi:allantoin racemase
MSKPVHVRLIVPVTTVGIRDLKEVEHLTGSKLKISMTYLDKGPQSIENQIDEALAVPDVIKRAIEAEAEGVDAVIIDCVGDPGLKAAREAVKINVFGPGQASMAQATMLGDKFSVVTVLHSVVPMINDNAKVYGYHDKLASVRVVNVPVLELMERLDEVKLGLSEQAIQAVEQDKADTIILGCTGFLGCAEAVKKALLAKGHDVPVIDPIPTAVCQAVAAVQAGLAHSKKTYATPRGKAYIGYDINLE